MSTHQLRVFIGSAMTELRDVRDVVKETLERRGISAFVYENDAGAQPETVVETSLRELRDADVCAAIFWKHYPKVTTQEFKEARSLGKPCLVYIRDKDASREPDLDTFLSTEVYDLAKGVSYDYFESAVKLGQRIADDVMSWLVRRNRELTAEVAAQRVSKDELAKLQVEVQRLQAVSREPLPQGTAADQLARDLRGWFSALGYSPEREIERSDNGFKWLINIPERRGFAQVLVLGVEGVAELAHLRDLESSFQREKADEGWLVSIRRVSQAVRDEVRKQTKPQIFAYTLDELLDANADFSRYFNWLQTEVRRRGIDSAYVPLSATKDEFEPKGGKYLGRAHYGRDNGWLEGYIDRWLADPSKEHISILGEFGTGKTSFALHYAWKALQKYVEAKERGVERPRVPLVIPLRDYAKAVTVESLFSEFFFRKYEMLPGYSAFEQLNRMGKLLLIFDGFDEMAAKVDRQEMINNFWRLARVVVPGSKAILTCRTEHFPEAKEGRALLGAELKASTANLTGEPPQFEVLELEKFDDDQIRQLLGYHADPKTVDMIMHSPELRDLARRPVMAGYILEALPDIEAGKRVDLARIYLYAVTRKMERDIESGRTFTSLADKLYFLCEVAWEMLSTDTMSLNYRQFPDRLANLFGDTVKEQKDLDHWHFDMMGQSLLVRNAEGDYTPAHRSLIEFFVAYKFAAELGLLAPDFIEPAKKQANVDTAARAQSYTWSSYFRRVVVPGGIRPPAPLQVFRREDSAMLARTFGHQPLVRAVSQLMASMMSESAVAELLKIAQETSSAPNTAGFTGGNAITLLLRIDPFALRGQKLAGANLDHGEFTGADLTGCDFRRAWLRRATIRAASLKDVQFQEADLSETAIEEVRRVTSVAISPDGHRYVAGQGDGSLRIGNIRSGGEQLRILAHEREVVNAVWTADGKHIITGGEDGRLAMWDAMDGNQLFRQDHCHHDWVIGIALDASGTRIMTAGGVENHALKMWDLRGAMTRQWELPGNQANSVSQSKDGKFVVISWWDRTELTAFKRSLKSRGTILFHCSRDGDLTGPAVFEESSWIVFFGQTSPRFYTLNKKGQITAIDADSGTKTVFKIVGAPICLSNNDELLVVQPDDTPAEAIIEIWHLPATVKLCNMQFGPENRPGRQHPQRRCYAAFSPDGSILIGGSDDGTIRFWDTAILIPGEADGSKVSRSTSPTWWQKAKIHVPGGMQPNPNFGREIRVLEQRVSCKGLRLDNAKGLDTLQIAELDSKEGKTRMQAVIEWFRERGAVISKKAGLT
jgi:NACHT-associated inactive Restriction Endonuclease 1/NACHT domain/Pentapeptide repeats (8 copies)/Domain of unknown function (DUF4062)/WD domain, G-beta repeat